MMRANPSQLVMVLVKGIPRKVSENRTQPWLHEGSLGCDPCHHRGPIF